MDQGQSNSNGWGAPGDTIALMLVAIGIVAVALWLRALPREDQAAILGFTVNLLTLILAQPGVFLTVKIASSKLPLKKKLVFGVISFAVVAFAIPVGISAWLLPRAQGLLQALN